MGSFTISRVPFPTVMASSKRQKVAAGDSSLNFLVLFSRPDSNLAKLGFRVVDQCVHRKLPSIRSFPATAVDPEPFAKAGERLAPFLARALWSVAEAWRRLPCRPFAP